MRVSPDNARALNNQLHATEYRMYELEAVRKELQATLKAIDKQFKGYPRADQTTHHG